MDYTWATQVAGDSGSRFFRFGLNASQISYAEGC